MLHLVAGDLFNQDVECLVNPWNMNYIPSFLLLPCRVSGALRKKAGREPFIQLSRKGILSPGTAVLTGGGLLKQKIIHVAALKWYWRSSVRVIETCVRNALTLASSENIKSIAFPLIGSGTGGVRPERSFQAIERAVRQSEYSGEVIIVRFFT